MSTAVRKMKKYWTISIMIPLTFYLSYIVVTYTEFILNIFLFFALPAIIIFSIVWCIFVFFKIRKLKLITIPLVIISLLPLTDIVFDLRFKVPELFKEEKVLEARTEGTVSSSRLILRQNKQFELYDGSIGGGNLYRGKYQIKNDTILIIFNESTPSFISNQNSKWIINERFNTFQYIETGFSYDLVLNNLK